MIDRSAANQLLDFSARIGPGQRAEEQLDGAVAVHNLLCQHRVAYLADEVGMGKTYVALGVLALFRHYQPNFRVLILAPRENIQRKWMKEFRNFAANIVRFPDLRVRALDGRPARELTACHNLVELVEEATLDPDRDFFVRMTSFSLPAGGRGSVDPEAARRLRDQLRQHLPWLRQEIFDLRDKQVFKDHVAKAICCALPVFDLVIVDEGHNLKHGFAPGVSARNRVLSLAFGHPDEKADRRLFPNYGVRARRVLFLSATPIENDYRQLWNQLHIFGLGGLFPELRRADLDEEEKKRVVHRFLIRRVTAIQIAGKDYTKNLYRREWRSGGVHLHDEPIRVEDDRQRLVVALVQKKVSELLGSDRFNNSFQIGMLASFESFLETAMVKRADEEVFDDPEQASDAKDALEREGLDVADVNRVARSYRERFKEELPHPKMDSVAKSLARSWANGTKTLVFVRRVASVKELKRKVDETYDKWLIDRLREELPEGLRARFQSIVQRFKDEKLQALQQGAPGMDGMLEVQLDAEDRGGTDTFFAWFFRGQGPPKVVSGANIQQRFGQRSSAYSIFFEDNYVAAALGCRPDQTTEQFAQRVGLNVEAMRMELQRRSCRFLSRAKQPARADRFEAVQAAAIEWLKEIPGARQRLANVIWHERFIFSQRPRHTDQAPELGGFLDLPTFFTELRERPALRTRLWPEPRRPENASEIEATQSIFREQELRRQMLSSAARLGHAFIDLYVQVIRRIGSFERRARETADEEGGGTDLDRINEFIALLEEQMVTQSSARSWRAFDELSELAAHFDLILDVNEPDAYRKPLADTARIFAQLFGKQQPTGGMSGQINRTLVRQFRLPGYPLVLISTELLQEGEDLHTFCSSIHHYGISWTPSSMEQRIGRIDRVRSATDRRLSALPEPPVGDEKLQVLFPHLQDTVEVLQVRRVLERMDTFLRLIHEDLGAAGSHGNRKIDLAGEALVAPSLTTSEPAPLRTAFAIRGGDLSGETKALAVSPAYARAAEERFLSLRTAALTGVNIDWEPEAPRGMLLGTMRLGSRQQPFTLLLQSFRERLLVRCVSPVGCVSPSSVPDWLLDYAPPGTRIGAILTDQERTYDLTIEEDVLLAEDCATDGERVATLVRRATEEANRLEQLLLPGRDEVLPTFRQELEREGSDGE